METRSGLERERPGSRSSPLRDFTPKTALYNFIDNLNNSLFPETFRFRVAPTDRMINLLSGGEFS